MYAITAIIGLFIGIWFTSVNIARMFTRQDIPTANTIVMAIGWTMFISGVWILP